jgi:hypothetical protein
MKGKVMNSIIKCIAWLALLSTIGCASTQNQGGTSDNQTSGRETRTSVAPASPTQPASPSPVGELDEGSSVNDSGLNRDGPDAGAWDDSNTKTNPSEDQEIEDEDQSNSPEPGDTDLDDNPQESLDDIQRSISGSSDESSAESPDESARRPEPSEDPDTSDEVPNLTSH